MEVNLDPQSMQTNGRLACSERFWAVILRTDGVQEGLESKRSCRLLPRLAVET